MKQFFLICIFVLLTMSSSTFLVSSSITTTANGFYNTSHIIMPWLCLQRCQFNVSEIKQHVADIMENNQKFASNLSKISNLGGEEPLEPLVNAIAFEKFNLGPNATLVHNNLFNLSGYLLEVFKNDESEKSEKNKVNLRRPLRIAMVSSYPYPKDFLHWMRQLFKSSNGTSQDWINQLGEVLVKEQIDGINIDFEPTTTATAEDAMDYAAFLSRLRKGLWKFKRSWVTAAAEGGAGKKKPLQQQQHHDGLITTATTATWAAIWNLTEIAEALLPSPNESPYSMGYATTMNTYTFMDRYFEPQLEENLDAFGKPPHKRGVSTTSVKSGSGVGREQSRLFPEDGWKRLITGFETWPNNFTSTELAFHFARLEHYNLCRLAMWDAPVPDFFWPHLFEFGKRCMY